MFDGVDRPFFQILKFSARKHGQDEIKGLSLWNKSIPGDKIRVEVKNQYENDGKKLGNKFEELHVRPKSWYEIN